MSSMQKLKTWVKTGDDPLARLIKGVHKFIRLGDLPAIPVVHSTLYHLHKLVTGTLGWITRVFYWTPLFKSRLDGPAPELYLYGGMPLVLGALRIHIGRGSRVSGQTTFSGRWANATTPELIIGDNCDVGWQNTIAVGNRVVLGNNVRLAGGCFLAGYPGHPLDAERRAAGEPEDDHQVGDIILEDDVWLATGVTVMQGVTIGRGTVVASGSVVTKSLPPFVVAAGTPAKAVKDIPHDETQDADS